MPYLAVATTFGLLIAEVRHANATTASLVIAAGLLATLVSIRQFLAQRDLGRTQEQLRHQSQHDR